MPIWYMDPETGETHPATREEEDRLCADFDTYRRVALTKVGDSEVSTVFLALDHRFYADDGPPILFESLVFGGPLVDTMERYATREEALAGHERLVRAIKDHSVNSLASAWT